MPKIVLTCNYCGHEWERTIFYQRDFLDNQFCDKCKDTNIRMQEIEDTKKDVFGYNSDSPKKDAYIKPRKGYIS